MSEREFPRRKPNDRASHLPVSNLKGQKPLPAIIDTPSINSIQHSTSNRLKGFNTGPELNCSKCGVENSASSYVQSKYKWIKTSQQLIHRTGQMDLASSLRLSDSSKMRSIFADKLMSANKTKSIHKNIGANPLTRTEKADKSPDFFVKNSKCVRQLPPIDMYKYLEDVPFRPACPTPVSPPLSPQEQEQ